MSEGGVSFQTYFDNQFGLMRQDILELKSAIAELRRSVASQDSFASLERKVIEMDKRLKKAENTVSLINMVVVYFLLPVTTTVAAGIIIAVMVWLLGLSGLG